MKKLVALLLSVMMCFACVSALADTYVSWYTYGDVYLGNEREYSAFNFEVADTEFLFQEFADREVECLRTLKASLPLPAYDCVMKCSHAFNILDARGAISATERANYILRVRAVAKACCESYLAEVAGKKDTYSTKGEVA